MNNHEAKQLFFCFIRSPFYQYSCTRKMAPFELCKSHVFAPATEYCKAQLHFKLPSNNWDRCNTFFYRRLSHSEAVWERINDRYRQKLENKNTIRFFLEINNNNNMFLIVGNIKIRTNPNNNFVKQTQPQIKWNSQVSLKKKEEKK